MKKIIGLFSFSVVLLLAACGNESQPAAVTQPAPAPAKEVIVVTPAAPTVIVKGAPAKSTTIKLDKNGVKVGTKKVDIEIKRDNK